jgi:hypothetical protein
MPLHHLQNQTLLYPSSIGKEPTRTTSGDVTPTTKIFDSLLNFIKIHEENDIYR